MLRLIMTNPQSDFDIEVYVGSNVYPEILSDVQELKGTSSVLHFEELCVKYGSMGDKEFIAFYMEARNLKFLDGSYFKVQETVAADYSKKYESPIIELYKKYEIL